jgi:excinuclease ABC subunit C
VAGLISTEDYRQAIRDVQLFLEGRPSELEARLTARMAVAAENMQFELAARLRDQLITVSQAQDRQRIASPDDEDADVFGFHYESDMLAVNLFHMRGGKIVDRREMFWEDLVDIEFAEASHTEGLAPAEDEDIETETQLEPRPEQRAPEIHADSEEVEEHSVLAPPEAAAFSPAAFFSALLKQLYLDQAYVPKHIYVPVDFPDRVLLAEALRERCGFKIEIAAPQRGDKRSLVDLVCQNAKQSYDQRFRVLQPSIKAMQDAIQDALTLAEPPERIECFDISHIQGAETVASMVVWEKGAMKKADYRKFQVKSVSGVDDFASMREIVHRRYKKLHEEKRPMPSLILIDGGLGQLHAAAEALEEIGLTTQPLASIAKKEEIIYVHGQEDEPVVLDRRSPVLHAIQKIRDESHRFAVTYHRKRREMRDRSSELDEIPGVGPRTRQRLLEHFGSVRALKQTAEKTPDALTAVVNAATAEKIRSHFAGVDESAAETSQEPVQENDPLVQITAQR